MADTWSGRLDLLIRPWLAGGGMSEPNTLADVDDPPQAGHSPTEEVA